MILKSEAMIRLWLLYICGKYISFSKESCSRSRNISNNTGNTFATVPNSMWAPTPRLSPPDILPILSQWQLCGFWK